MQWTFPATGPLRAEIELPSGAVEMVLAPTEEVRVLLEPIGAMTDRAKEQIAATTVACEGDHLVVLVPKRKLRDVPLRLAVLVPPQTAVACSTASADVSLAGVAGRLGIGTASGDVVMDGPCDAADVSTASGDVRLGDVLGEIRMKSASGDVFIDTVGGRVEVGSASGDVAIGLAGGDVKVRTASGDIKIAQASQGEVSLNCASGDIVVGVAEGVGTWLDIATVSGDTKCTLPAESNSETEASLRISCRTVSGDVRIQPGDVKGNGSQGWSWNRGAWQGFRQL